MVTTKMQFAELSNLDSPLLRHNGDAAHFLNESRAGDSGAARQPSSIVDRRRRALAGKIDRAPFKQRSLGISRSSPLGKPRLLDFADRGDAHPDDLYAVGKPISVAQLVRPVEQVLELSAVLRRRRNAHRQIPRLSDVSHPTSALYADLLRGNAVRNHGRAGGGFELLKVIPRAAKTGRLQVDTDRPQIIVTNVRNQRSESREVSRSRRHHNSRDVELVRDQSGMHRP